MKRVCSPRAIGFAVAVVVALVLTGRAAAMPMFSRRYHMACSACHDAPAYPRLNSVGYLFRRAGFRMPEQIGEKPDEDFDLAHYFSARSQLRYQLAGDFEMRELTFFPLTGSFERFWGSQTKIMLDASGRPTVNNAYLRGVWGDEKRWFTARAGIGHPIEGYGASDRPLGASRPLFETATSNDGQDTLVRLWGADRLGVDLGVQWKTTSVSVSVLNQLTTTVTSGEVTTLGVGRDADAGKDVAFFVNQLIGERAAFSAYWTHGTVQLPVDVAAYVAGTDRSTWFGLYDRAALFGSAGVGRVVALAGVEAGRDQRMSSEGGGRFSSGGAFVEADVAITDGLSALGRADYFDPSRGKPGNERFGGTLGAVYATEWIKLVSEAQLERTPGPTSRRVDASLRLHATVAF